MSNSPIRSSPHKIAFAAEMQAVSDKYTETAANAS